MTVSIVPSHCPAVVTVLSDSQMLGSCVLRTEQTDMKQKA